MTVKDDLWELASVIAFERLGLVLLRQVDGKCIPPSVELAAMPAEEARKARRKYRKLWRRSLYREMRDFEKTPQRSVHRVWSWTGADIRGNWKCAECPYYGQLLIYASLEVGERPSWSARGYRWKRVKESEEYRKMIKIVALELGLLDPLRNM